MDAVQSVVGATDSRPESDGAGRAVGWTSGRAVRFGLASISILLFAVTISGLPYYLASPAERVRSTLHVWFRSSGYVGQSAGLLAFALFLFLWLYPLRKRVKLLRGLGGMRVWLDAHMAAGMVIPWLGAIHAGWRFQGVIGLGYLAMLIVCASGFVGRFLYTSIPRRRSGAAMTADEIRSTARHDLMLIADLTGWAPETIERRLGIETDADPAGGRGNSLSALRILLAAPWRARAAARVLRREMERGGIVVADERFWPDVSRTVRELAGLRARMHALDAARRWFHYWHIAHMPFAITALIAVTIHVAVCVALGTTWLY